MWRCLLAPTYTSLTCNHSNITRESDNLPEINFTYLLPSLRAQEKTMAVAVSSNGRAGRRRDGFPSPEGHSNPPRAPTTQRSSWIICHLQPVLAPLINITTTDKILVGLRIQTDPGCEFCAAFRSALQSSCVECQCVIGGAGEITGRAVLLGL